MQIEVREYQNSQLFILENDKYIEYTDMREAIDFHRDFNKGEVIILKEQDKYYSEYLSEENVEEYIYLSKHKEQAIMILEEKYKLWE